MTMLPVPSVSRRAAVLLVLTMATHLLADESHPSEMILQSENIGKAFFWFVLLLAAIGSMAELGRTFERRWLQPLPRWRQVCVWLASAGGAIGLFALCWPFHARFFISLLISAFAAVFSHMAVASAWTAAIGRLQPKAALSKGTLFFVWLIGGMALVQAVWLLFSEGARWYARFTVLR